MKLKFTLALLLFSFVTAFSQNGNSNTITVKKEVSLNENGYDMTQHNRPKYIDSPFTENKNSTTTASRNQNNTTANLSSNPDIEAFAQLNLNRWGVITDMNTNAEIFFNAERTGNTFTVNTYDNDMEVVENFSIQVPASANQVQVLNHQSTNFFSDDALKEYMIYLHYFEGENPGPDDQVWEIWMVKSDGTIVEQVEAVSAEPKIDANGNKRMYTYIDDETTVNIKAYNTTTWTVENSYSFDSELINFFMGLPFQFVNVDGQEYAVIAHYAHLFMDNATLEVYPDNNLIVKLLDMDLNEVQTMTLDIESRYPNAGEYVIPRADFGQFYRNNMYDISKNIFNNDNKFEVVYGISYYDIIADNEWSTYLVANEDGTVLNELNEYIIANYKEMTSIDGQDNQLGFLMGQDGNASNIGFFNIES